MKKYNLDNLYQSSYPLENTNNLRASVNPNNNDLQSVMRFNVAKQEWEPYMVSMDFIKDGNLEIGDNLTVIAPSTAGDDSAYKNCIPSYLRACAVTGSSQIKNLFIILSGKDYYPMDPDSTYLLELEYGISQSLYECIQKLANDSPEGFYDDTYEYWFFGATGWASEEFGPSLKIYVVTPEQYTSMKEDLNLIESDFNSDNVNINIILDYSKK